VSSSVVKDTVREEEDEDEEEDRVADTEAEPEVAVVGTEAARKGEDVMESGWAEGVMRWARARRVIDGSRERCLRSARIVRDGQAEGKHQQPQQRDHTQRRSCAHDRGRLHLHWHPHLGAV
jgi:hypothetical protein